MGLGEGVPLWGHQYQLLRHQGLKGDARCRVRLPDYGKVQTLIHQADGNVGGAELKKLHGNAGITAVEFRKHIRKDPLGAVGSHSDTDRALIDSILRKIEGEVLLHVQNLPGVSQADISGVCGDHAVRRGDKQRRTQFLLQPLDIPGDGGPADAQTLRRLLGGTARGIGHGVAKQRCIHKKTSGIDAMHSRMARINSRLDLGRSAFLGYATIRVHPAFHSAGNRKYTTG